MMASKIRKRRHRERVREQRRNAPSEEKIRQAIQTHRGRDLRRGKKEEIGTHRLMTEKIRDHHRCFVRTPGTWECSVKTKNADKRRIDLVRHLFEKYRAPAFLAEEWNHEETNEIPFKEWYIQVAQGRSLAKTPSAKRYMTKREIHLFVHESPRKCERAIHNLWWAKARGHNASRNTAEMLAGTNLGKCDVDEFWCAAMQFFIRFNEEISNTREINDYIDFLQAQRQEMHRFSLKGRTPRTLELLKDQWHIRLTQQKGDATEWAGADIEDTTFETTIKGESRPRKLEIRQICTSKGLAKEGREMNHCVYDYMEGCVKNTRSVWSAKESFEDGAPVNNGRWTMEVQMGTTNNKLLQARAKHNNPIGDRQWQQTRRWANMHEIEMWKRSKIA